MAKLELVGGTTGKLLHVFIGDSTRVDGGGLTGLVYNTSGLTWYYFREGDVSATQVTMASPSLGTYTSGGFVAVDGTNMPGWYEISPPNACFNSNYKSVKMHIYGAANMVVVPLEVEITATDNQTSGINITKIDGAAFASHTAGYFPVDNVGSGLKKNQAAPYIPFVMRSDASKLPVSGLTVTVTRMIDGGGSFAAGTLSNVIDTGDGGYTVDAASGDMNGKYITFLATATGADPTIFTVITVP